MPRFIITRILHSIPLLFGITLISFFIMQLAPGDYFTKMQLNPEISKSTLSELRAKYGLDKPVAVQYFRWLKNICRLDFGTSMVYQIPVFPLIKERLLNTLLLSVVSLFFIWLISVPLGIICARNQYKFVDHAISGLSFVGISLPTFFFAFLLLYISSGTGILPSGGIIDLSHGEYSRWGKFLDYGRHMIIPVTVLVFASIPGLLRVMRGNMLGELNQPYVIMARAKGLSEEKVIYKHALRNAANPMITIFGYQLSGLLSGAALLEIILSWPGLGQLMLSSLLAQDIYVVMASLVISSGLLIAGNLTADILLALVDPRIRK